MTGWEQLTLERHVSWQSFYSKIPLSMPYPPALSAEPTQCILQFPLTCKRIHHLQHHLHHHHHQPHYFFRNLKTLLGPLVSQSIWQIKFVLPGRLLSCLMPPIPILLSLGPVVSVIVSMMLALVSALVLSCVVVVVLLLSHCLYMMQYSWCHSKLEFA